MCVRHTYKFSQTDTPAQTLFFCPQVAQALVLQQARKLNAEVVDKLSAIQAVASRAVEVFFKNVSAGTFRGLGV